MKKHYLYNAVRNLRREVGDMCNSLSDKDALEHKRFLYDFEELIGQTIEEKGYKFRHGDKVYKTTKENHTFRAEHPPGRGTESLYTEICLDHSGTLTDPIPYNGNMELEKGKYYSQDNVVYLCIEALTQGMPHELKYLTRYVKEVK